MKRDIEKALIDWKSDPARRPLLIRGARQVGKSYAVVQFGRAHFENVIEVNFEQSPVIHKIFQEELNPRQILNQLALYYNQEINPGKTLLFFDEIQECPRALMALRYFYEEMPELHLVGAGSLMEFVLQREDFKMPVGRVQYLWMKPLSFGEFLDATDHEKMRQYLQRLNLQPRVSSEAIHQKYLGLFKEYARVGGMPAAVASFVAGGSFKKIRSLQESLLQSYRDDFGKYASKVKPEQIDKVFWAAAKRTGQKIKYTHLDTDAKVREIKNALSLLIHAGLFCKIRYSNALGLPLEAEASEKKFKIIFLDLGLVQCLAGLDGPVYGGIGLGGLYQGSIAEQFVGQELLAYHESFTEGRLYFWTRETKSSSAEIDYLFQSRSGIFPVEVKSQSAGRLKSLRLFMQERRSKIGIRLSSLPLSFHDQILSVPLYAVEALPSLIKEALGAA